MERELQSLGVIGIKGFVRFIFNLAPGILARVVERLKLRVSFKRDFLQGNY